MPKITREEIAPLEQIVSIIIEPSDYEAAFNKEIKTYQKESNLKGFRKGKAPVSYIKKIAGKQILTEEVSNVLSEQLQLIKEETPIFGDPIITEDSPIFNPNPKKLTSYEFKFHLGLMPEFELKGLDEPFTSYKINWSDEKIDEVYHDALKSAGEQKPVEDNIQEKDIVKMEMCELEGDDIKEEGIKKDITFAVDLAIEELKEVLMQHKAGDTIRFNINNLEKDIDQEYLRKYILEVEEDVDFGDMFEGTIVEVKRLIPAEPNQEFFDNTFEKGKVTTEEEAKAQIAKYSDRNIEQTSNNLAYETIREKLEAENKVELPENFIRLFLRKKNDKTTLSDERLEKELPYVLEQFRWIAIRKNIIEKHEIVVTEDDIFTGFVNQFKQYTRQSMGMDSFDNSFYFDMANRMMQNEKSYNEMAVNILENKVKDALLEEVSFEEKVVTEEELEEIVKEQNKKNEEKRKEIEAIGAELEESATEQVEEENTEEQLENKEVES